MVNCDMIDCKWNCGIDGKGYKGMEPYSNPYKPRPNDCVCDGASNTNHLIVKNEHGQPQCAMYELKEVLNED